MVSFEVFLLGLLVTSTMTGLVTEGVKKVIEEHGKAYRANTLAGVIAIVVSLLIGFGYIVVAEIIFTAQTVVCLVALMVLSWLCAMVGYDKVIQAISQFKA